MQLKRKSGKRASLAAATLGLLGATVAPAPAAAQDEPPVSEPARKWQFDTGVLVYAENDGRVRAIEPVITATRDLGDEYAVSVKFVLDSLTGATPNGAAPASTPQTFSGPSGTGHTYTTAPGATPLDDTFLDTRYALSGEYAFPLTDTGKLALGLNASTEYDFFSGGGSVRYTHDFNQRNTSLSAGLNYEADTTTPVGGIPAALTVLPPPPPDAASDDGGGMGVGASSESKSVTDLVFGVTQVLDPLSLMQVNYSLSTSSGYHTDPYKIVSVVDANGEPLRYVFESRPDSRTKHAVFLRYKRFMLARDVFDLSYRFLTDDWGVTSSTVDTTYRWNFSSSNFIEPHLRWYVQGAADFYRVALYDGEETTVDHASSDERLGAFDGVTIGLKYGHTFRNGSQWSARAEYYQQSGKRAGVPGQAAAGLAKFDVEPDVSATMFTVGYRFKL